MEKAGLYVRLSDEDEDKLSKEELSKSIINQQTLLKDYANEHNYSVYKIYCDDDYSGLYDDRPGFQAMIEDAKAGKIKTIIAKTQSRFSRNMEHIEKYLHNEFVDWGVRFIGVVDGTDTAVRSNKKSRQIYAMTNEWYCEDLSVNVHAVFDTKMKKGDFIGSFAPYGYKKDPKNKNHLMVDEDAAKVVQRIFRMYLSGEPVSKIGYILSQEKIPTPAIYKKQQGLTYKYQQQYEYCEKYGLWADTTIRRILQNRAYLGCIVQGKTRKLNYKSKKMAAMPKEDWIVVPNMHTPIISKEEFDEVQNIFSSNIRSSKNGSPHVLAGKIVCAECKSSIVSSGSNKDGTRTYMKCTLNKNSRGDFCTAHKFVLQDLEQVVLSKIQQLIEYVTNDENSITELTEFLMQKSSEKCETDNIVKRLSVIDRKLEDTKKMQKSLYIDKVNGIIDTGLYLEMTEEFNNTAKTLEAEKAELKSRLQIRSEENNRVLDYCNMVRDYCNIHTLTKEIVNKFIDHIEVSEQEEAANLKLIIYWNV